jgi:hypothetical protein
MNRKTYIEAFNKIQVSPDIENKIMDVILTTDLSKRKKYRWRYGLIPVICGIVICLLLLPKKELKCELLSDSTIAELDNVKDITIKQMENDNSKATIETVSVSHGQMIILDSGMQLKKEDKVTFAGNVTQKNSKYEIGYIYDGNYNVLESSFNSATVLEEIEVREDGDYYFCITNLSNTKMDFSGMVSVQTDDLIYHLNSIYLNEGEIIYVDIAQLKTEINIQACYIQNCSTGNTSEIPLNLGSYGVIESGTYRIYAISDNQDIVDLSEKIGIQEEVTPQNENSFFIPLNYKLMEH